MAQVRAQGVGIISPPLAFGATESSSGVEVLTLDIGAVPCRTYMYAVGYNLGGTVGYRRASWFGGPGFSHVGQDGEETSGQVGRRQDACCV